MFTFWQNSEDIPSWVQLFLVAFVLIGIVPFFQKTISRIKEFIRTLSERDKPDRSESETASRIKPATYSGSAQLNEYEYIVFRRLAMTGEKGLSLNSIAAGLHMDRRRIEAVLKSLIDRGLVEPAAGGFLGRRYALTRKGHDYALEQGFIIKVRKTGPT